MTPIREPLATVLEGHGLCKTFSVWFDGACEPRNPGGVATCGWLVREGAETLCEGFCEVCRGPAATNNVAEWSALGFALRWMLDHREQFTKSVLRIHGDSKLVIEQLNGNWACNKPHLQKLRDRCRAILAEIGFASWTAEWIPREQNAEADALSRKAYEQATGQRFPERSRR